MDQLLPPDDAPATTTAVRTEDHVVWSSGGQLGSRRIEPGFVAVSWLACVGLSAGIALLATGLLLALDQPLTNPSNEDAGISLIVAVMSTFIGFAVAMSIRLVHVSHDRLSNSLAVAAMHVVVAGVAFVVGLVLGEAAAGSVLDDAGAILSVYERSAAAAIVACGLAAGMVPAIGARPPGVQTERTDTEHQL